MVDVPLTEARAFEEPPLSWKPFKDGDGRGAIFICPNGHTGTLVSSREGTHDIDREGVVSPSVVCPECDFHDHVRLVGWADQGASE